MTQPCSAQQPNRGGMVVALSLDLHKGIKQQEGRSVGRKENPPCIFLSGDWNLQGSRLDSSRQMALSATSRLHTHPWTLDVGHKGDGKEEDTNSPSAFSTLDQLGLDFDIIRWSQQAQWEPLNCKWPLNLKEMESLFGGWYWRTVLQPAEHSTYLGQHHHIWDPPHHHQPVM